LTLLQIKPLLRKKRWREKDPSSGLALVKLDFLIGTKWGSDAERKQNRFIPEPENPAKVLIPLNRVAEAHSNYQPVNTSRCQKTQEIQSRQPTHPNLFCRRTNEEQREAMMALHGDRICTSKD